MYIRNVVLGLHDLFSHDEELMRYLFYKANNKSDDVLDSNNRPNIVGSDEELYRSESDEQKGIALSYMNIVDSCIRFSHVADDLNNENQGCLLAFYLSGITQKESKNGKLTIAHDKAINVDIYCHVSYDEVDFRLSKIIERLYQLLNNARLQDKENPNKQSLPIVIEGGSMITDKSEVFKGFNGFRLNLKLGGISASKENNY